MVLLPLKHSGREEVTMLSFQGLEGEQKRGGGGHTGQNMAEGLNSTEHVSYIYFEMYHSGKCMPLKMNYLELKYVFTADKSKHAFI